LIIICYVSCSDNFNKLFNKEEEQVRLLNYKEPVLTININKTSTFLKNTIPVYLEAQLVKEGKDISDEINILKNIEYDFINSDVPDNSLPIIYIGEDGLITPVTLGTVKITGNIKFEGNIIKSNNITFEVAESDAGVTVNPTGLTLDEGLSSKTISFNLNSPPNFEVLIDLVSNLPPGITVFPEYLIFKKENYDEQQHVKVSAVDNHIAEGSLYYQWIIHSLISDDFNFAGIKMPTIDIAILDDDINPIATPRKPVHNENNVSLNTQIQVYFDKPMDSLYVPRKS